MAFATSERTLPGVSAPSRVVRSMSEMMRVERPRLRGGLDGAGAERGGALLEADGVDAGDAVEVSPQGGVVGLAAEHGERALARGDE